MPFTSKSVKSGGTGLSEHYGLAAPCISRDLAWRVYPIGVDSEFVYGECSGQVGFHLITHNDPIILIYSTVGNQHGWAQIHHLNRTQHLIL